MAEDFYRDIIDSLDEGFCIIDVIFDDAGKPVNWRYLEANPRFTEQAGRSTVIGQTASVLFPDTEPYLRNFFGKVTLSGISAHMEYKHKALNQWYDVSAYKIGGTESRKVAVLLHDITSRKLLEESLRLNAIELQNSEKESLELIDGFTEGSWIVDCAAGTIKCSERWAKRLGLDLVPEQDRLSFTHTLSYLPDQQDGNSIEHCMAAGMARFDLEYRVKTLDSGYIWTQNKGKIIYDEQGVAVKVYAATIDITERKRTEEALRESEERFHIASKNSSLEFAQFDTDLRYVWIHNPHVGLSTSQILGKCDIDLEDSEGSSQLFDLKRQVIRNKKSARKEVCFNRKDGLHTYDFFIDPIYDTNRELIGGTSTALDITKHKHEQEDLVDIKERMTALMDNNPSLVFLKDEEGRYVYLNKEYEKHFILSDNWYGKTDFDFWPKESAELFRINDAKVLNSGQITQFLEDSKDLKGTRFCWLNYKFPFTDSKNRKYVGGIGIDATRLVLAEEALKKSEEQMKQLVAVLKEADKNKNQFISVLSHELRNPLAVIVASLSLLEFTNTPEQVSSTNEIVKSQVGQMTKLVDDLLDLTRINQNKINLKKENVNLNELLGNLKRDMTPEYREKGVRLSAKLPKDPIILSADPVRLAQSVGNILKNALKFTPANGYVELSLEQENGEAVVSVKDNGMGIAQDLLDHLFDPFVQGDSSLERTNSGSLGLGLAIVKGIVELHGGSVSANSSGVGRGARFTIWLPAAAPPAETYIRTAEEETSRRFRILLIEDNKSLADVLLLMIEHVGHEAYSAHTGLEGVTEAKRLRPDVIFCDIGLPGMNGYEVAKFLKADEVLKGTTLIALSGYTGEDDIERAQAAGFDRHLAKPIDMAMLMKVLAEIS